MTRQHSQLEHQCKKTTNSNPMHPEGAPPVPPTRSLCEKLFTIFSVIYSQCSLHITVQFSCVFNVILCMLQTKCWEPQHQPTNSSSSFHYIPGQNPHRIRPKIRLQHALQVGLLKLTPFLISCHEHFTVI